MDGMSEWITDRRPTSEDAHSFDFVGYVWVTTEYGIVLRQRWDQVGDQPWMPIARPEPYVKPKRWTFFGAGQVWTIFDEKLGRCGDPILPTRKAAERIAAIYEEVMP